MVALQNEIQAMMNIGLIGCGMWGRNLARNLAQLEALAAVAIAMPKMPPNSDQPLPPNRLMLTR